MIFGLEENGITLNKEKYNFWKKQTQFLGHVVSRNGIESDPKRTEAIVSGVFFLLVIDQIRKKWTSASRPRIPRVPYYIIL